MGVVDRPISLGRRYILRFFWWLLNSSVLLVVASWFLYLSLPSMDKEWFPSSRTLGMEDRLMMLFVGV
jgi:hypothetical protein